MRGQHRGPDVLHREQARRPAGAGPPPRRPRYHGRGLGVRPGRLPPPQLHLLRVKTCGRPHLVHQRGQGNVF